MRDLAGRGPWISIIMGFGNKPLAVFTVLTVPTHRRPGSFVSNCSHLLFPCLLFGSQHFGNPEALRLLFVSLFFSNISVLEK